MGDAKHHRMLLEGDIRLSKDSETFKVGESAASGSGHEPDDRDGLGRELESKGESQGRGKRPVEEEEEHQEGRAQRLKKKENPDGTRAGKQNISTWLSTIRKGDTTGEAQKIYATSFRG